MYVFSANTVIRSAQVNANFNNYRAHIIPIDPNTATAGATKTYDLGSSDYRWRNVYGNFAPAVDTTSGSTTITNSHNVLLMNTTSATLTATLPTAIGYYGQITIKNIGTGGKTVYIDANATETIDNTLTVNLVDFESTTLVSDQSNWWAI